MKWESSESHNTLRFGINDGVKADLASPHPLQVTIQSTPPPAATRTSSSTAPLAASPSRTSAYSVSSRPPPAPSTHPHEARNLSRPQTTPSEATAAAAVQDIGRKPVLPRSKILGPWLVYRRLMPSLNEMAKKLDEKQ
ncbi:unnamed protein product [Urochloa humidicola]